MLPVFFNRKDSCHIGKRNIRLVFEKIPQKIKVLLLQCLGFLPFTHHAVPLIHQKDKLPVCFYINSPECRSQPGITFF